MQSRLIDCYLFRLLLDSLVFLYLVFYCAGFSLCGFSLCGFATSGFSMCGYCPCGGKEKGAICALSSVFLCRNIGDMAMPSKTAYSERKRPKSTFILTVNCPVHPPFKSKKMPVPQRLISSAMGTGGLDFLIAYALLILCHSLFEIVIQKVRT